ncbi:MAG: hypothetical protein OXC60_20000 [Litoreibacter sp.]|nr:hypothetical protein [Litoreibacter sp.]
MTKLNPAELDFALRTLIDNPEKLDEVKEKIQSGQQAHPARSRASEMHNDDYDDMFDNLPV